MKLIVFFILIAFGIVAWTLFNPGQQDNMLAMKKAIGIDSNNPYAGKLRSLSKKQQHLTDTIKGDSSSLDGARLSSKLFSAQDEIINELEQLVEGLQRENKEEEIVLSIDDSDIIGDMMIIQRQLKDNKFSDALDGSKACARMLEGWAKEIDGSD